MGWGSAGNLHTEIITQMLAEKVGLERAREIFPLNINPDDSSQKSNDAKVTVQEFAQLHLAGDKKIMSYVKDGALRVGSNNWAVAPLLSANGKPIVANDPHTKDQIKAFIHGDKVYWWFSDEAIKEHSKTTLVLKP